MIPYFRRVVNLKKQAIGTFAYIRIRLSGALLSCYLPMASDL